MRIAGGAVLPAEPMLESKLSEEHAGGSARRTFTDRFIVRTQRHMTETICLLHSRRTHSRDFDRRLQSLPTVTARMGFSPPLGTTTFLTASDATRPAATRLYFTYIASKSDKDSPGDRVPEIWTNLSTDRAETTSDVEPEWHAVPLSPSPDQPELYVTSLPVPSIASERAYEFTYRFRNAKTDETEWVGSSDANGKFRIVDGSRLDTRWEGPDLASVKSDDWQRFEGDAGQGDAAVGRFKLDWNEDGTTRTRDVDLGSLIPEEWRAAGAIEGLVWERSSCVLSPFHTPSAACLAT